MMIYDEGTQAEKRAILQAETRRLRPSQQPPAATTYFERQRQQDDQAAEKAEASPLTYPSLPASSPWASNAWGEEPPLGIAIDDMEPTGTAAEAMP